MQRVEHVICIIKIWTILLMLINLFEYQKWYKMKKSNNDRFNHIIIIYWDWNDWREGVYCFVLCHKSNILLNYSHKTKVNF